MTKLKTEQFKGITDFYGKKVEDLEVYERFYFSMENYIYWNKDKQFEIKKSSFYIGIFQTFDDAINEIAKEAQIKLNIGLSDHNKEIKRFKIGKTYKCRSIGDYDCIFSYTVIARTKKQMTIKEGNQISKRGIYIYEGSESCKPEGTYSMCPVIRADKEVN